MRTRFSLTVGLLALTWCASGAIVDRSAVTVGTKVITDSDITRRIRLAAFQNGELPDFSLAARREAVQRLIDLKLVESEMEVGNYTPVTADEAEALLKAFTAEHFQGSAEALGKALGVAHLTPADLESELAEQADLLSFTSLRFRPAVDVSDQQIEKYYHEHVENAGAKPVSLDDARAGIERILGNEQADSDLDAWLRDQRAHTKIVYLESDLQ